MQPSPFEVVNLDDGKRVASDGVKCVLVETIDARVFKRRGITGIGARPVGEVLLPMLNQLAGELLGRLDMPREELTAKLGAMMGLAVPTEPKNVEWLVVRVGDVNVFVDRDNVVVTREDLRI